MSSCSSIRDGLYMEIGTLKRKLVSPCPWYRVRGTASSEGHRQLLAIQE